MKNRMILLMSGCLVMLAGAACGGKTTVSPTPSLSTPTSTVQPAPSTPTSTVQPAPSTPTNTDQPAQPPATEAPDNAQATTSGCEEYFGFCVTSSVSGAVTGAATAGAPSLAHWRRHTHDRFIVEWAASTPGSHGANGTQQRKPVHSVQRRSRPDRTAGDRAERADHGTANLRLVRTPRRRRWGHHLRRCRQGCTGRSSAGDAQRHLSDAGAR